MILNHYLFWKVCSKYQASSQICWWGLIITCNSFSSFFFKSRQAVVSWQFMPGFDAFVEYLSKGIFTVRSELCSPSAVVCYSPRLLSICRRSLHVDFRLIIEDKSKFTLTFGFLRAGYARSISTGKLRTKGPPWKSQICLILKLNFCWRETFIKISPYKSFPHILYMEYIIWETVSVPI